MSRGTTQGYGSYLLWQVPHTLTGIEIKKAKADGKPRKIFDVHGLFLFVAQGTGVDTHKRWRFKFNYHKKEKLLALGVYPAVTLAEARKRRDKARALLEQGIDPTAERKSEKRQTSLRLGNTFSALANDWFDTKRECWSPPYAADTRKFLDRELIPEFGSQPITEITPRDLPAVIRKIERRDAPAVAEKVLNIGSQILRHGALTGLLSSEPSRDLRGALKSREVKHHARLTESELPEFLEKIDSYSGAPVTRLAIRLRRLGALLLRSEKSLAARNKRERQRYAAPITSEGHRHQQIH